MNKFTLIALGLILNIASQAQFRFSPNFKVPVTIGEQNLQNAWEGGLNSPQFQTLDLDQDGDLDLILYHRISRDLTTYLLNDGKYIRSPQFDNSFPEDTRSLFLLKDYDCDGKKDLFTSTSLGIKVYRNTSNQDGIKWSLASEFLTFDDGANIQLAPSDIPGIADINGDGALDILTFRFGNANSIDYYMNTGNCGSLSFTRAERRWGDFEECGCNNFVFGEECPVGGGSKGGPESEMFRHIGGKMILLFDSDNDGDLDLLTSDETCETLYFLENEGSKDVAKMTKIQSYPMSNPAGFPFFPSAFLEDINQDGLKDLLIATNADENIANGIELSDHIRAYPNQGTNEIPQFSQKIPFFQNEMIDLGENTYPAFADMDNDGDLDLFVGNKGLIDGERISGSIHVFENTGNRLSPTYSLLNNDFLGLRLERYTFIKPQFVDLDGDNDLDLTYQATNSSNAISIYFRENQGNFEFGSEQQLSVRVMSFDSPHFFDIDLDGDMDLLVGKQFGSLSLFINEGNLDFGPEQPSFAGIENDFERLNLNVSITDIDNNGITDLLTIDLTGQLRAFRGPIDLDFLATNPISDIYLVGNDFAKTTSFGIQNHITTGDIFGNARPAVVLGNTKGGLTLLNNESENNGPSDNIILVVRPNPARNEVLLLTSVNGTLDIFNSIGQRVATGIPVIPGEDLPLDVSGFQSGTYIFRVVSEQNETKSVKVIIE